MKKESEVIKEEVVGEDNSGWINKVFDSIIFKILVIGIVFWFMYSNYGGGQSSLEVIIDESGNYAYTGDSNFEDIPYNVRVNDVNSWRYNDFTIVPLSKFSMDAVILGQEEYFWGGISPLSKVDLSVGWGPINTAAGYGQVLQSRPFENYIGRGFESTLTNRNAWNYISVLHTVPGNSEIKKKLERLKRGDKVKISGYQIRGEGDSGQIIEQYSNFGGDGMCEIVWIDSLEIVGKIN